MRVQKAIVATEPERRSGLMKRSRRGKGDRGAVKATAAR